MLCVLIALAETLQGNLRLRCINRLVGDRRARQIGVFTGSAIILGIAWACLPWIGARFDLRREGLLGLGMLFAPLLAAMLRGLL